MHHLIEQIPRAGEQNRPQKPCHSCRTASRSLLSRHRSERREHADAHQCRHSHGHPVHGMIRISGKPDRRIRLRPEQSGNCQCGKPFPCTGILPKHVQQRQRKRQDHPPDERRKAVPRSDGSGGCTGAVLRAEVKEQKLRRQKQQCRSHCPCDPSPSLWRKIFLTVNPHPQA